MMICLLFLFDRYTSIYMKQLKLLLIGGIIVFLLQFIGAYRSIAADGVGILAGLQNYLSEGTLFNGTWTAALLTPLATLGDYYFGERDYLFGKTYLDFFLSIPPTPVANFFNYDRPITSWSGPAWDVSYGAGGTYISVVPFMNFSMIGVFVQTALVGLLIATIDRKVSGYSPMWTLASFAVGVVLWGVFWYGEMYLLRAIVTTFPILAGTWYVLGFQQRSH
jgi:hypothetical protein